MSQPQESVEEQIPEHEVCTLKHEKQLLGGSSSFYVSWGRREEFITL